MHPRSIDVALAVREAADRKLIDPALLDARAAGPLGYARATKRLRDFGLTLNGKPTVVLFVESGLWTRFAGGAAELHATGPQPGDAVIVTSEAVVAAILDGRMSAGEAAQRGLLFTGI